MALHHTHDASFELPAGLKDKTVHLFALSDSGPSEFNLVLSHADGLDDDTVGAFADRLLGELRRSLAKFELKDRQARRIDGSDAVVLQYAFQHDGVFLHQRQAVVLVQGDVAGQPRALMLTATCPTAFDAPWLEAFEQTLTTMRLREPWQRRERGVQASPAAEEAVPPRPIDWPVFALREGRLHVLADADSYDPDILPSDVAGRRWQFFDSRGWPLEPVFLPVPGGNPRQAGPFELQRGEASGVAPLLERLTQVNAVRGPGFAKVSDVKAHLQRRLTRRARER